MRSRCQPGGRFLLQPPLLGLWTGVLMWSFLCVSLCPNVPLLEGHQSSWTRAYIHARITVICKDPISEFTGTGGQDLDIFWGHNSTPNTCI